MCAHSARLVNGAGSVFDAKQALASGLIDEIVAPAELLQRAIAVASYSEQSLQAYPLIKAALQRESSESMTKFHGRTRATLESVYQTKAKAKL